MSDDLRRGRKISNSIDYQASPEVLTALSQGNHDAYVEIYSHYRGPVGEFLHALTGSHEVAEDITHDVFVVVWENRRKLDPAQGIHRYLYAVAKNLMMRYFRRQKNDGNYLEYRGLQSMEDIAPEELVAAKEIDALVGMAVSRMPRIRGQIFAMYYNNGMDYGQIADKLGINKATVANHLTNAKNDIRKILALFVLIFHFA